MCVVIVGDCQSKLFQASFILSSSRCDSRVGHSLSQKASGNPKCNQAQPDGISFSHFDFPKTPGQPSSPVN